VPPVERTITDDFVDALRHGGPLPAPGREVLESVKVLEACYRTIDPLL
jgi:predicted dehydrogenase